MVTADSNFKFEEEINNFCRKSSQKLHALSRISQCLSPHKKRIFLKTFVTSQFNYCPLAWMCHSRTINNRINNIHHWALRIVYQDKKSTFEELLQKSVFMWQLETQLFASSYIWLPYIFEASYSTVVTPVSEKSSVDQSELEK